MSKIDIRIADTQFAHSKVGDYGASYGTGDLNILPSYFNWVRTNEQIGNIIFITESCANLIDFFKEKIKVLLIIETEEISPNIYSMVKNKEFADKFTYILTFSKDLVAIDPQKFIYTPFGGSWINKDERKIYDKTKGISIIASAKRDTRCHILRHDAILRYTEQINGVYGNGYQFIQNKLEGLKDYRYSIVIEQAQCRGLFSEKIIDCFMTGVIPIYCGDIDLGEIFNMNGVIQFASLIELKTALQLATKEHYEQNLFAIKENFTFGHKYDLPEDKIYETFLKYKLQNNE